MRVQAGCEGAAVTPIDDGVRAVAWAGDGWLAFTSEILRFDLEGTLLAVSPLPDAFQGIARAAWSGAYIVAAGWTWSGAVVLAALARDGSSQISDSVVVSEDWTANLDAIGLAFDGEAVPVVWTRAAGGLDFARVRCE